MTVGDYRGSRTLWMLSGIGKSSNEEGYGYNKGTVVVQTKWGTISNAALVLLERGDDSFLIPENPYEGCLYFTLADLSSKTISNAATFRVY